MKGFLFISVISFLLLTSCGKKDNGTVDNNRPLSNLQLTAVVNPDNSGNVAFTASAVNAVTYDYDFGNGVFQTVASGSVTYRYPSGGTYTVSVIAKNAAGETLSKSIQVTVTVSSALVWSEEFNVAGTPDPSKWGNDIGGGGWGNAELQYYTNRPENATVSNGTLKITAIKENFSGSAYTSARLLTKDKFSFKYGKIDIMAKLPTGGGTWPAIWMLGSNISTVPWPGCGEIDIMEHKGNDPNKIYGTLHHPGHSGGNADGGTIVISNASTQFHKYTTQWTAASIKFYVDDLLFYTFANNASLPFNQNFFIILNVAMGGTFGGAVDPAFVSSAMEIDYIRVYN